jgi:hypothetical protein
MEALGFSETMVTTYQKTRCHNPERQNLNIVTALQNGMTVLVNVSGVS